MTLDIGIGIFAAITVSGLFSLELTPLLVGVGIALALIPDFDLWYILARRGVKDQRAIARHRDIAHYPLIYLPIGALLALPFGPQWPLLFLLSSLGHFIHDSIGIGWGIPWMWPFIKKNYSFFYRYSPRGKKLPRRIFYSWKRSELDEIIDKYGDPDWFKNIYLKLHPFFIFEIIFFVVALIALWHVKI